MTDRKFEAHITCDRTDSDMVQQVGEATGWSFSTIDGDPIMGKKPYAYLTHYSTDGHKLLEAGQMVVNILKAHKVISLRLKVEEIVFDSKTEWNVLTK